MWLTEHDRIIENFFTIQKKTSILPEFILALSSVEDATNISNHKNSHVIITTPAIYYHLLTNHTVFLHLSYMIMYENPESILDEQSSISHIFKLYENEEPLTRPRLIGFWQQDFKEDFYSISLKSKMIASKLSNSKFANISQDSFDTEFEVLKTIEEPKFVNFKNTEKIDFFQKKLVQLLLEFINLYNVSMNPIKTPLFTKFEYSNYDEIFIDEKNVLNEFGFINVEFQKSLNRIKILMIDNPLTFMIDIMIELCLIIDLAYYIGVSEADAYLKKFKEYLNKFVVDNISSVDKNKTFNKYLGLINSLNLPSDLIRQFEQTSYLKIIVDLTNQIQILENTKFVIFLKSYSICPIFFNHLNTQLSDFDIMAINQNWQDFDLINRFFNKKSKKICILLCSNEYEKYFISLVNSNDINFIFIKMDHPLGKPLNFSSLISQYFIWNQRIPLNIIKNKLKLIFDELIIKTTILDINYEEPKQKNIQHKKEDIFFPNYLDKLIDLNYNQNNYSLDDIQVKNGEIENNSKFNEIVPEIKNLQNLTPNKKEDKFETKSDISNELKELKINSHSFVKPMSIVPIPGDPISTLSIYFQKNGLPLPVYEECMREGNDHQPIFTFNCKVLGQSFEGSGNSKKIAKKQSAQSAIDKLELLKN